MARAMARADGGPKTASAYGIEAMLSWAPPSARALYRSEWRPAYAALDLWHERST